MKKLIFFLPVLALFSFVQEKQESKWELRKFENGISVYSRTAEGSNIKELKSVFQIKTSLSSIVALLDDFESYPQWVYRCAKSSTLKKTSDQELIHYQSVAPPWPVSNRDIIVKVDLTQDPVTKVILQKSTCIPDYIPRVEGHIRVVLFKALWTLTPLKNGLVNVEYQLLLDPGGMVPAWVINLGIVDGPYETELKMKKWLFKEKYQSAKISFITEP